MSISIEKSIEILERTPNVLRAMLQNISDDWTSNNEGGQTWSAFDIVGHLIHGEKTDWIPRIEIILSQKSGGVFEPFDRFAQFEESRGKTLLQLLDSFEILRKNSLETLQYQQLTTENLSQKGIHPTLGEVSMSQLLATWVVHDLNHIAQIARVMAKQLKHEVGPWADNLRILEVGLKTLD